MLTFWTYVGKNAVLITLKKSETKTVADIETSGEYSRTYERTYTHEGEYVKEVTRRQVYKNGKPIQHDGNCYRIGYALTDTCIVEESDPDMEPGDYECPIFWKEKFAFSSN